MNGNDLGEGAFWFWEGEALKEEEREEEEGWGEMRQRIEEVQRQIGGQEGRESEWMEEAELLRRRRGKN